MSAHTRQTAPPDATALFAAGYLQALDDVAKALALPVDAGFLQKLRTAVGVKARAAVAKAAGAGA